MQTRAFLYAVVFTYDDEVEGDPLIAVNEHTDDIQQWTLEHGSSYHPALDDITVAPVMELDDKELRKLIRKMKSTEIEDIDHDYEPEDDGDDDEDEGDEE